MISSVSIMSIQNVITRIQLFVAHKGLTKAELAREAGIPRTTLRLFGQPEWNPTANTLRALESTIPDDFQVPFPLHDPELSPADDAEAA